MEGKHIDTEPTSFYPFQGTSPQVITFDRVAHYLVLFNNGSKPLTFTVGTTSGEKFTSTVKANDVFDEHVGRITYVKITAANGTYSGYARRRKDYVYDPKLI